MTPPRHDKTPQADSLTDTGERRAIVDEVEARLRDRTPVTRSSDSSEHIRAVARDEAERTATMLIQKYQSDCVKEGPICGVWEEIGKMRTVVAGVNNELSERKGADKAQARNLTIIVGVASAIGVAANLIGLLWKVRHGG